MIFQEILLQKRTCYFRRGFNLKTKFQWLLIKMLARFSALSVLGFIMISSKFSVLSDLFPCYKGSFLHNVSFLQEFSVC